MLLRYGMSQADSASCHSEAKASRPNLKMDTINLKLQLVEGIKKQLVLGEELNAHRLQTRTTKPALISPSIVFKDAIASEKDYISKQSNPFFEGHIKCMANFSAYQSLSHSELEEEDQVDNANKGGLISKGILTLAPLPNKMCQIFPLRDKTFVMTNITLIELYY